MSAGSHRPPAYPRHCWYVVATAGEVTGSPLARRALDTSVVLYRLPGGAVVVLEDRDVHRPYPLSRGRLEGDLIVSAYSGFAYAPDGSCVRVPTQAEVPYGARVRAFPVLEQDGLVWVWFAEPGLAPLHRVPAAPWLADPAWATFGQAWQTRASFVLLHENFADIAHVAVVDPELAPPVLSAGPLPLLEVEVSETSVGFHREYPPAPLAGWHAALLQVAPDARFVQHERGRFVTAGLWVDSWQAIPAGGSGAGSGSGATFRFTHAVTPVDAASTRHVWRVSRDFALDQGSYGGSDGGSDGGLEDRFARYYRAVQEILETMQEVLLRDGPRADVGVAADAAALQVRRIVARMVTDEGGPRWPT